MKKLALLCAMALVVFTACAGPQSSQTGPSSSLPESSSSSTVDGAVEKEEPLGGSIRTVEELLSFAETVNSTPPEEQMGVVWTLEADLDLAGMDWEPVGRRVWDEDKGWTGGFAGVFDGGGHTISGFQVRAKEAAPTGFFGALIGGSQVLRLHLEGEVTGEQQVGGLAGTGAGWDSVEQEQAGSVLVADCSFTGTVRSTRGEAGCLMGATGEDTTIRRCWARGEVYGASSIGGLAGSANNGSTIADCWFSGTVISDLAENNETNFSLPRMQEWGSYAPGEIQISSVGGFVGGTYNGSILHCWSDATLVTKAPCSMTGIFIGYHSGRDVGCYYNKDKAGEWGLGYAYPGSDSFFTALGLTGEEMSRPENYEGWDFGETWEIDPAMGRPVLQTSR